MALETCVAAKEVTMTSVVRPLRWRLSLGSIAYRPLTKGAPYNSVIAQCRGEVQKKPCCACAGLHGPFSECVIAITPNGKSIGKGACANCLWRGAPNRCTLRSDYKEPEKTTSPSPKAVRTRAVKKPTKTTQKGKKSVAKDSADKLP
ncbi:hypothetical protein PRK78_002386 [Emydomyces testavorans]|uniref:Uncharacterized protein n=1 Tax=Emydomyces testavorans TaxID=2070801 RepID=A0AAF0DEW6_9EURO|nr:hypothetical protein PRK78_002386 [Emydomyces testavorans]